MTRAVVVLLGLCGCDAILGLPATTLAGDVDASTTDSGMQGSDACASPDCMTFASCQAVEQQFPAAASGVYSLDAGTGMFRAYCELEADGGGWTLALKIDGTQTTFAYDAAIWTDATLLGETSPGLDNVQAKLEAFNAVAFTQVRVGFEVPVGSGTRRYAVVAASGQRLRDLFAGPPITSTLGRDAWKGAIGPLGSLQPLCNAEGINQGNEYARVRIGIIGNNEDDCATPDSYIGLGAADMGQCLMPAPTIAGNVGCYGPDNGEVNTAAFGFVFVR